MTDGEKYLVLHIIIDYGQRLQVANKFPKSPNKHSVSGSVFVVKSSDCDKFYIDDEGYYCVEGTDLFYHKHFSARVFCQESAFAIELNWDLCREEAIKWCRENAPEAIKDLPDNELWDIMEDSYLNREGV